MAAEGKSALFVAEKRAAIDAVLGRLDRLGLGDLVLDAYDGTTNRRATARQFARALDSALSEEGDRGRRAPRSVPASSVERTGFGSAGLGQGAAGRLVAHVRAMHSVREPWGVSVYQVQEALAELAKRSPSPTSRVRLNGAILAGLGRERIRELAGRLRDASGLGAWAQDGEDPWFGAWIVTSDEAARALDITTRLSSGGLDEAGAELNALLAESHVPAATSLADWESALETMAAVRHTLEVFRPDVFDLPLDEHIAATATREWRDQHGVDMGWLTRWKVRQQAKRLLRPGRPPEDLHESLRLASEQRTQWFALVGGGGRPEISPRLDEGLDALDRLRDDLGWLEERLPGDGPALTELPLVDLGGRLAALASRTDRLAFPTSPGPSTTCVAPAGSARRRPRCPPSGHAARVRRGGPRVVGIARAGDQLP